MEDLRTTYNRIARPWHEQHLDDVWWIDGTNEFAKMLPPNSLVLDVGCGSGVMTKYLTDSSYHPQVIGIDFAQNLITIAREVAPNAEFQVMDMRDVATIPQNFHGIYAKASLLHIPRSDVQSVVDALVSRLTIGGFLYVAVKGAREGLKLEEVRMENDCGPEPYCRFFSYFFPHEVEKFLTNAGLVIEYRSVMTSGRTEWIQVIGQKIRQ